LNQKKFGLNQLAVKIANENEELLTNLDLWEKFSFHFADIDPLIFSNVSGFLG